MISLNWVVTGKIFRAVESNLGLQLPEMGQLKDPKM